VGIAVVAVLAVMLASPVAGKLKEGECEVCVKVVEAVRAAVPKAKIGNKDVINAEIKKFCKTAKDKDNRFCYYIGGTADAATGLLNAVTHPMSNGLPTDRICEQLKTKDLQICELRYAKAKKNPSAVTADDLKKMRVSELRDFLSELGGECQGCTEKSEYVKKIEAIRAKQAGQQEL